LEGALGGLRSVVAASAEKETEPDDAAGGVEPPQAASAAASNGMDSFTKCPCFIRLSSFGASCACD
jgi:hypothetical protein